jgi:hypothetical protein
MIRDFVRKVQFRLKWLFMDNRARYAYLWARTRENW